MRRNYKIVLLFVSR